MYFKLRNDARKWFKDIEHEFGQAKIFDMYYFCLIAGLATNRKSQAIRDNDAPDLVESFPGEYSSKGRLIIALFISRELKRQEINLSERSAMNKEISKLVDPDSASRLKSDGMKLLNQYADAGFEVILEWFGNEPDNRPRQLSRFLILYKRNLDKTLKNNI